MLTTRTLNRIRHNKNIKYNIIRINKNIELNITSTWFPYKNKFNMFSLGLAINKLLVSIL